jgi:16S rRNA (guanine527-N7)-methyltransferase
MPPPEPAVTADGALGRGAAQMGCMLDEHQLAQFDAYRRLLQRWGRVYNLTAVRDEPSVIHLHLLDSLSAVPPLDRWAQGRPLRVLDVGSGGGLPGVAIAIARPAWRVACVDAVAKKARFVQQVAIELRLTGLTAMHARIEQAAPAQADVVVSRAFASLIDFVALTRHHLSAAGGVWLAMKGKVPHDEIAALPGSVEVFHVEPLHVPGLDAERCLVWMRPAA